MLKITVKIEEKNLKKNKEKIGKKNLIRDDFHERMHSTLLYFDAGSSTIKSSHRCFMFNKSMFLRFFEDDFFRCSLTLLSLSLIGQKSWPEISNERCWFISMFVWYRKLAISAANTKTTREKEAPINTIIIIIIADYWNWLIS